MKPSVSVFFLFLLLIGSVRAQNDPCTPNAANLKRAKVNYTKAYSAYENRRGCEEVWKYINIAEKIEPCFAELHLLKATVYEEQKNYDSAIASYKRAFSLNPTLFPNGYYFMARLEIKIGKYRDADMHFNKFLSFTTISDKLREEAEMALRRNREILKIVADKVEFSPRNLGPAINSDYDDYFPSISVDDSVFIFTRRYQKADPVPHMEEDLFVSHRDSTGSWTPAVPLPGLINSNDNEGAQSISPNGQYLFFATNRKDGMGLHDIYVSYKTEKGWDRPRNIGQPVNTSAWESQPCFSSDGKTLYFASNRPGGFGGIDIYKSELKNGVWSRPLNLGPNINTEGNEEAPFIHPDGRTLYFSSTGHNGLGGADLYVSRMDEKGRWSTPQNLGYPINTHADETMLRVNAIGDTAYFASNSLSGTGGFDIYCFPLHEAVRPTAVSFMKGRVYDAKTGKPLAAKFELIDLRDGSLRLESVAEEDDGEFLVSLPSDEVFALNVSYPGYLFYSEHIALDAQSLTKPKLKSIALQPVQKQANIVLNNIFYKTNEYALEESSMPELRKVFWFLKDNPSITVEISGHTDNVGSDAYNKTLSQNRARAVADFLINSGIETHRINAVGYGSSKPVADNQTEEGRAKNRRTEMKIL